ncbi:hypothetical protein J4Q44_G00005390 [Coregonus suidteri]|uniref:Uncharacterized protein n=1 Tax=Coregonus suidteri TaxID=861788 RepID=A0AAN8NIR6_9TELE
MLEPPEACRPEAVGCGPGLTPLLAQPQPSQLQSSAPAPATPAAIGDTGYCIHACILSLTWGSIQSHTL